MPCRLPAVLRRAATARYCARCRSSTTIAISDSWLCDRGRYNIGFYASPERITQPLYRKDGGFVQIGWDDAFLLWARRSRLRAARSGNAGAIGGGRLINEEAFLLQHVFPGDRRAQSRLARGTAASSLARDERRRLRRARARERDRESRAARRRRNSRRSCGCACSRPRATARQIVSTSRRTTLRRRSAGLHRTRASRSCGTASTLIWVRPRVDASGSRNVVDVYHERTAQRARRRGDGHAADRRRYATRALMLRCCARRKARRAFALRSEPGAKRSRPRGGPCRAGRHELRYGERALHDGDRAARRARLAGEGRIREERHDHQSSRAICLAVNASLESPTGPLSDLEMLIGLAQQFDLTLPTIEELDAAVVARSQSAFAGTFGDALYHSGASRHPEGGHRSSRARSGTAVERRLTTNA